MSILNAAHKIGTKTGLDQRPEYFFTAVSMFMAETRNGLFPEILYLITPAQLKELCTTFGGQTIRVPTTKELGDSLKAAAVAHYRSAMAATDDQLMAHLDINKTEMKMINRRIEAWSRVVEDSIGVKPEMLYAGAKEVNHG